MTGLRALLRFLDVALALLPVAMVLVLAGAVIAYAVVSLHLAGGRP